MRAFSKICIGWGLMGAACLVLGGSSALGMEEVVPAPASASRYAAMREHCPFAVATPVAAPAPPQASFAANWYVSGIGRMDDADFVSIKARDQSSQFSLFGREPDPNGVSLVSIEWVEGIGKSVVTIQKGTETAKLEFNEAVVHGAPQSPVPQNPVAQNASPNAGRGATVAVVTPPVPPAGAKTLPNAGGYDPSKVIRTVQNIVKPPPVAPAGVQPNARGPYSMPNGVAKPMTPYPRRPFVPLNQAAR